MTPPKKRPATSPLPEAPNRELPEILEHIKELSKKQEEMSIRMGAQFEEMGKKIDPDKGKSLIKLCPVEKRQFTLNYTFQSEHLPGNSLKYNFFGIDWMIQIGRHGNDLSMQLAFFKKANPNGLSIDADIGYTAICKSCSNGTTSHAAVTCNTYFPGSRSYCTLGYFDQMKFCERHTGGKKNEIEVIVDVTIRQMTGLLRISKSFDESMKKYSDVVLILKGRKFFVNRAFLASRCSYFDRMFYSNFAESKKDEIEINEIDEEDFQTFLEVIYGQDRISDVNAENLLHLVQFFDAPDALQRIERILMLETELEFDKLWYLARTYKMPQLAKDCISKMQIGQVRQALKANDLFMPLPTLLGNRAVELHEKLEETICKLKSSQT